MNLNNVINIQPYIEEKRRKEESERIDVLDIIEDLTKYVDAYKLILEN